jgi:hypothetical protein
MPYAATLYFEGRETGNNDVTQLSSDEGKWDEIDLISLDKCVGFLKSERALDHVWLNANQSTLDSFAQTVLGLTGSERDKAYLINESNWRVIRRDTAEDAWIDDGNQITLENDAIADAHNRTHYADFKSVMELSQLRFTVKSVMNTNKTIPDNPVVVMPEMQLFGLPTDTINKSNAATVSYLKVEDVNGNLHNILGRHGRLPPQRDYNIQNGRTHFRFYVGEGQHLAADSRLYLSMQNPDGTMIAPTLGNPSNTSATTNHKAIGNHLFLDLSESGNRTTEAIYFEVYTYSSNNEKIILSSGHTGIIQ